MNNDLISRSELKSVLKNECFWCANRDESCDKSCWHCINEKIDNAPTVETHDTVNMYCDKDTQIIVEQIRLQGEWRLYFDKYRCSNCGTISKDITIYCSNCGAKMKGGAE